jgi:hypothetical protein
MDGNKKGTMMDGADRSLRGAIDTLYIFSFLHCGVVTDAVSLASVCRSCRWLDGTVGFIFFESAKDSLLCCCCAAALSAVQCRAVLY